MDDAHEDMLLDREITRSAFKYSIHESRVRLWTAVAIIVATLILIPIFLFCLEPPESLAGVTVVGLAALTPLIGTLLNSRNSNAEQKPEAQD